MRLYVGSRDYKPEGFLSVDIDPAWGADIIGDITNLHMIGDSSVDEIVASHVLEHLAWPNSLLALSEFQRTLKPNGILKIAVPDAGLLAELIASGKSSWHAIGLLFGVGRIDNAFEAHQYSYTTSMMCDILTILGFDTFEHWNSDLPDASNGWQPIIDGAHVAISLNIKCHKARTPLIPPQEFYNQCRNSMLSSLEEIIKNAAKTSSIDIEGKIPRSLIQSMHMQLIEERQTRKNLEAIVQQMKVTVDLIAQHDPRARTQPESIEVQSQSAPRTDRKFLLVMPCKGYEYELAVKTINSLSTQESVPWSLVVISDIPSPDPLFHSTDILGWLQIDSLDNELALIQTIHSVLNTLDSDWISIIPPGMEFSANFVETSATAASENALNERLLPFGKDSFTERLDFYQPNPYAMSKFTRISKPDTEWFWFHVERGEPS
jgi:predicted SAM-dependent methyltransferase